MTDVGARCPPCARLRRLPTYQVPPLTLGRGLLASLLAGGALGLLWGLLLPATGLFLALFLGLALGFAIAEAVGWATNRKRGLGLQGAALLGILAAYEVRNLTAGLGYLPPADLSGYLTTGVAILLALGQLR